MNTTESSACEEFKKTGIQEINEIASSIQKVQQLLMRAEKEEDFQKNLFQFSQPFVQEQNPVPPLSQLYFSGNY